ncbi:MAG: low molecular weight phosphotyrosine protein phosphatase [Chlorobi bacterium]|nr:low molecular weight phosphotyrosine protein phosphatase [Chlorobiota bacterium]
MNVLFVCLGNICRSPIAEALLKKKYAENDLDFKVDSAGFEPYHINKPPDEKATNTAKYYGLKLTGRARLFVKSDFQHFDRIYAMDAQNINDIKELARSDEDMEKVDLIMNLIEPGKNEMLPDPFHSGVDNCHTVYKKLDKATDKLLEEAKNLLMA